MTRCFSCITALVAAVFVLCSYTVQQVPNPKNAYEDGFVSNPDDILNPEAVLEINQIAAWLRKNADVELAVVAIKRMDGVEDEFEFAQKLFNLWGIGDKKNQGVLIFLETTVRGIRIHTGGGLEGLLPDAFCEDIVDEMIPELRKDFSSGILLGTKLIAERLTTTDALAELLFDGYKPQQAPTLLYNYLIFCVLVFWLLFIAAQRELVWNEGGSNNVRYNHAQSIEMILWFCAVFFPLPVFFLAWWFRSARKGLRTRPVVCPVCGKTMTLLSESDEDEYLNSGQQSEEIVGSVDYDVWHCECGNNIILPYVKDQTKYTHCPSCASKTYYLYSDVVKIPATQFHVGQGERTNKCRHCNYSQTTNYVIPKTTVVVVGGSGGRGHGGSSGGSWGGGISFGGGAGGRF